MSLIGVGIFLVYRKIAKAGTAVQRPHRRPNMIDAMGSDHHQLAVSTERLDFLRKDIDKLVECLDEVSTHLICFQLLINSPDLGELL